MSKVKLCLWASTLDMLQYKFIINVLTGTPEEIAQRAVDWGYDGIEFMPDPERTPDPEVFDIALQRAGAVMPVVGSGRMIPQGMTLINEDVGIRRKAMKAFKNVLDFAGYFKARVVLGGARGTGITGASKEGVERLTEEIFRELAEYAKKAGAVIMLEGSSPKYTNLVNSNEEVMAWVERIGNPSFSAMMDTDQLCAAEPSIEHGIRATKGRAHHIHLYDPNHWPPGILPEKDALDWSHIARILQEEDFAGSASIALAPEGDPEFVAPKAVAYMRRIFDK